MKTQEEELQERILNGENPEGFPDMEVKSYRQVFHALKNEHSYELPDHFADSVVSKIYTKRVRVRSRDTLWFVMSLAGMAMGLVLTLVMTRIRFDSGFFNVLGKYWGIFVLGAVLVTVIQVVDGLLIRTKYL